MITSVISAITHYGIGTLGIAALLYMYARHLRGGITPHLSKKIAFVFAAAVIAMTAFTIAANYFMLRADAGGKLLLPPYQPWDWFVRLTLSRDVFPVVVSFIAGIFMYYTAILTNRSFSGELFAEEDKYILLFAALVVGWPNFIVYLAACIILTVFLSGIATLRHGTDTRIVLTDALLFAIPITLLCANTLAPYLDLFRLTIYA